MSFAIDLIKLAIIRKELEIKMNGPFGPFDPDFDQITQMALMIPTPSVY